MPFFTQPTGFSINGGSFTDIAGNFNVHISRGDPLAQGPLISVFQGRDKCENERKNSDLRNMQIIKRSHLKLKHELHKGVGYRLHSARTKKGKAVVIKVFEGPLSEKHCAATVAFSRRLWHSNLAQLVGTSEENSSTPFIVFSAEKSTKKIQSLIAKALPTDLFHGVGLTLRMVKGVSAGLHYIGSQNIPLRSLLESRGGLEKFVILCSDDGEPVLAIDPSEMGLDGDDPPAHHPPIEADNWLIFDGLCERTFNEINSIRYDDVPERMPAELHDASSSLRPEPITEPSSDAEFIPELELATSASQSQQQPPRREILWRIIDRDNQSLETVSKEFGEYLEVIFPLLSSPLPRVRGTHMSRKRIQHKCSGYLREEITLTSDIAKSAIVSHTDPMVNEKCLRCGRLVEVEYEGEPTEAEMPTYGAEIEDGYREYGSGYEIGAAGIGGGESAMSTVESEPVDIMGLGLSNERVAQWREQMLLPQQQQRLSVNDISQQPNGVVLSGEEEQRERGKEERKKRRKEQLEAMTTAAFDAFHSVPNVNFGRTFSFWDPRQMETGSRLGSNPLLGSAYWDWVGYPMLAQNQQQHLDEIAGPWDRVNTPMSAPSPSSNIATVGSSRSEVDLNPPINTLYVGNLPTSPPIGFPQDILEENLRELFTAQPGFCRLVFRHKSNGPMCFVEFEDLHFATKALNDLYGHTLKGLIKGAGLRLSYSKNPLGVRAPSGTPFMQQNLQSTSSMPGYLHTQ